MVIVSINANYGTGTQTSIRADGSIAAACPKCRRAVAVRKRLLLILPEGDKYEYVCPHCGSTCGDTIIADTPGRKLM